MRLAFSAALVLGAALPGAVPGSYAASPLRMCADPDNLPFSTAAAAAAGQAGTPGLYVEIGQAVAGALGRPMETVRSLSYFGKRNLRTTLLADQCDFAVGLPAVDDFMGLAVVFTRPFISVGYAIAAPWDRPVAKLGDFDGKRVAVQFNPLPQSLLATRPAVTSVTVMDPDEGMRLLADRKVDAAFVWGPSAGYDNRISLHDGFRVVSADGAQMRFGAAIGFSRKNAALRDEVDAALPALADRIAALAEKHALPTGPGIQLAAASPAPAASAQQAAAEVAQPVNAEATPPLAAEAVHVGAAEGRSLFNQTCSHCHGPDEVQSGAADQPAAAAAPLRRRPRERLPHDRHERAAEQGGANLRQRDPGRRHRQDLRLPRHGPGTVRVA